MICWSGWASNNAKLLRRRAMNIPSSLTVSRLLAIPVLMALLLLRFPGHDQVAAALFVLFSLTDTLDGELARRRGTVSDFGKFLDPLADKLFVLSVLIVLVQEGLVAAWVVVVIFSRELLITILRSVGASQGHVIGAAPLGKTKTVTQMAAVALLILQRPYPELVPLAAIAVAVAVVFTMVSGVDYLVRFRHMIGLGRGTSSQAGIDPLADELGAILGREGSIRRAPGGFDHRNRRARFRRIGQAGRPHLHRHRLGVGEPMRRVHVHRQPLVEPAAGGGAGPPADDRGGSSRSRPAGEKARVKSTLTSEHLFATLLRRLAVKTMLTPDPRHRTLAATT